MLKTHFLKVYSCFWHTCCNIPPPPRESANFPKRMIVSCWEQFLISLFALLLRHQRKLCCVISLLILMKIQKKLLVFLKLDSKLGYEEKRSKQFCLFYYDVIYAILFSETNRQTNIF